MQQRGQSLNQNAGIYEPMQSAATQLRQYSGKHVYAEGDLIQHSKFGQGRVIEVRGGKIDVRFGAEIRILLHAFN